MGADPDGPASQGAAYNLRIESRRSGLFRAFGWLISWMFARRLAQLNLPLSNGEVSAGFAARGRAGNAAAHGSFLALRYNIARKCR